MRAVVLCVGILSVVGCATNRFGAPGVARRFYLSTATVQGNKALDACARGYHMASRFELLDPTVLHYDASVGVTADDAGSGPPSHAAAYGSQDPTGWVRTGGSTRYADTSDRRGSASANCDTWSTNSAGAFGTVAYLTDQFTSDDGRAAPLWNGGSERCDAPHHVWCIEDGAAERVPSEEPRRRHHPGESDFPP